MRVKFILPALAEAGSGHWRSIKYSLFPPLGLALLAGYLNERDTAELVDEHVMRGRYDDTPDLVAIEVYVTNAKRAYRIADSYRSRGVHVVLGGLHATALPAEARAHCDTLITGPAEEAWPRFLADFRTGNPAAEYSSRTRDISCLPSIRRDLFERRRYLVPNSLVVSRGCPHSCDFCYKENFFRGGKSFYRSPVDWALRELATLPGRHAFFLDDNIFADADFCRELFGGMRGLNKVWQGAATVASLRDMELLDLAAASGLRSLFIGFETLSRDSLASHNKRHNNLAEYEEVIAALHARGVMINASFVFGMENDDRSVFAETVRWAVAQGLETATFHILTPYPGSELHARYADAGRILTTDWDLYDTRHAVFAHPTLSRDELEQGYASAYREFYSWRSIFKAAASKPTLRRAVRHFAYTAGWKKFDPLWRCVIAGKRLPFATRILEYLLDLAR